MELLAAALPAASHFFDRAAALRRAVEGGLSAHQSGLPQGWPRCFPPGASPLPRLDAATLAEISLLTAELPALLDVPACRPRPSSLRMAHAAHPSYSCSESGVRLPWLSSLRPSARRITDLAGMNPQYRAAFESSLLRAIHRDLFEVVSLDSIRSSALAFLVFQGGKARLCADQSGYSRFLTPASCQYESPLLSFADPSTSSFVIADVFGAFQRVVVDEADRAYLGVVATDGDRRLGLRFKRLPFGLAHSPPIWEAAASHVTAIARGLRSPSHVDPSPPPALASAAALPARSAGDRYVDDFMFPDAERRPFWAVRSLRRTLAWLSTFDTPPALDKLYPWPCSYTIHLGLGWDAASRTVRVPASKVEKLLSLLHSALQCLDRCSHPQPTVPALAPELPAAAEPPAAHRLPAALAAVRRVAGLLSSFSVAVPAVNLFRSPLDDFVAEAVAVLAGPVPEPPSPHQPLPPRRARIARYRAEGRPLASEISSASISAARSLLSWWRGRAPALPTWRHRRFAPPETPAVRMVSDASDAAWGCLVWLPGRHFILHGVLSPGQRSESSGFRELVPLRPTLTFLRDHGLLPDASTVAHWSDSQVAVAFTTKWSASSDSALAELTELWDVVATSNLLWTSTWCSRDAGWVPVCDLISKAAFAPSPEYSLSLAAFSDLCRSLDVAPTVDLFATAASARLPRFCARSLAGVSPASLLRLAAATVSAVPGALAASPSLEELPLASEGWQGGAFDIPWFREVLYAFPPWSQLPRLLASWSAVPSGGPSTLLLVVKQPLAHLVERHPDLVRSAPLPDIRLVDERGSTCPAPPPWLLFAFVLTK